jgi:hypothetical protein
MILPSVKTRLMRTLYRRWFLGSLCEKRRKSLILPSVKAGWVGTPYIRLSPECLREYRSRHRYHPCHLAPRHPCSAAQTQSCFHRSNTSFGLLTSAPSLPSRREVEKRQGDIRAGEHLSMLKESWKRTDTVVSTIAVASLDGVVILASGSV